MEFDKAIFTQAWLLVCKQFGLLSTGASIMLEEMVIEKAMSPLSFPIREFEIKTLRACEK